MSKPLRRLQEEGAWFARAKETRLLWVHADGSSRRAALAFVEKLEYHADNASPFIVLDAPWAGVDGGGLARVKRFIELFAAKRAGLVQAGIDVGEWDAAEPADGRLDTLGAALQQAHTALRPPLAGLVIVLAPPRVETPEAFIADVRALIDAKPLAAVRWIVIESDSQHLGDLVVELGAAHALGVDVRVSQEDQRRDLAALAGPAPAPGAPLLPPHPWVPWSSGGAMPAAAAPRRVDDPPAPTAAQLEGAGLSPLYLKGGARVIKSLVVGASLALGEQRFDEAIELQARAAALFGEMNMTAEQVTALLVLGGYELAASRPEAARRGYEGAAALAASRALAEAQAQSELALGMLDALEERPDALAHYEAAGTLSEQARSIPLAIECWRMAGQVAERLGGLERADEDYQRALGLAEGLPPAAARATSAAEVARLLARIVEQRGDAARAGELQRQAFRLEHGVAPGPLRDEPTQQAAS
jgi:tetratricopeptide (TPR) repeat protein